MVKLLLPGSLFPSRSKLSDTHLRLTWAPSATVLARETDVVNLKLACGGPFIQSFQKSNLALVTNAKKKNKGRELNGAFKGHYLNDF